MKHLKLYEDYNDNDGSNLDNILLDEYDAIDYLKSIDFFESHGFDEEDPMIIGNIYEVCYKYKELKDKKMITIYRALEVPNFDAIDLSQVGHYWSFKKRGVGTYDAGVLNDFNKNWADINRKDLKKIILTADTTSNNIDWIETLVSNAIYGQDQAECFLNKGSDILITHINHKKIDNHIKAKS